MRLFALVLPALLLTGASLCAQTAPAAPAPAPAPAPTGLDGYLTRWEQEMLKIQSLSAEIAQVKKDRTFNTTTKLTGWAAYTKAGTGGASGLNLAAMELRPEGKREFQEKYICTGSHLYVFAPAQKEIKVYEMPKPKEGQVADEGFLAFLFGMRAAEAKRRYDLRLAKEDTYYVYVDVTPRFPNDKAEFQRARLILSKETYLPRQLWFESANGDEVLWDIPRLQSGARLDRRLFDKPEPPRDWRMTLQKPVDPQPQPRIIRTDKP